VVAIAATLLAGVAGCGDATTTSPASGAGVLRGSNGVVFDLAFSRDGRILASGGDDNTLRLWDVRKRTALGAPLGGYRPPNRVLFSPRGHTLVYAKANRIRMIDARTRKQIALLRGHQLWVAGIALSSDGRRLASTDRDTIRLWDLRTHRQIGAPLPGVTIEDVALSPDGRTLAYADGKLVRLRDTQTREQLGPALRGQNLEVGSLSFSRDGRTLLANGLFDASRLWDVGAHKQIGAALPGDERTESVVLSPDGRTLAYTDGDAIRRLDVATRKAVGAPLHSHGGAVVSLAFSPDGRTLAAGVADKTIRLWDL
jgi:WD40 repeat protein